MSRGELPIALYWVMVAIILGLYILVLKTVDLGFYILFAILVLLGIGYSIVYGGTMIGSSFIESEFKASDLKNISKKLDELEKRIDKLTNTVEEIKKLLEE